MLQKNQTAPTVRIVDLFFPCFTPVLVPTPHVVWEGFKKKKKRKKKKMFSSKHNPQHIQLSDTTGTSNGTGFYGQM